MTDRHQQPSDENPPWMEELLRRMDEVEEKKLRAEELRWQNRMESIGFDVSTPVARASIRQRNEWVTSWQSGSTRMKLAGLLFLLTGLMSGVGSVLWHGLIELGKAALSAKGSGP